MILCVDPDATTRERTTETLGAAGFEAVGVPSIAAARDHLGEADPVDCLVTEHELPDGTGLELVSVVRSHHPDASCLLYTDTPVTEIETDGFGGVIADYLKKDDPNADADLVAFVEEAIAFGTQRAYPLPENEAARLAALAQYTADPAGLSETFERLTEIAAATFGVNAAAIGLIGNHEQEFLGCYGVSLGAIDREDTICTYAILEDDVTVIEDTSEDPRYRDNDGLMAAEIRFYASASLRTPAGESIGTFCLYDDEPRSLSADERALLSLFADDAMEHLELRRQLREVPDGE